MAERAIDRVIAHWHTTRMKRNSARGFGVDGDAGIEIHWGPWTLGDQDRVFTTFPPRMEIDTFARILIVKAEDASGRRLFADVEEAELLAEADPNEVMRIANLILKDLNESSRAANESEGTTANPR